MPILKGIDRNQVSFTSLESMVATDSEVRLIDAFVECLDIKSLELVEKGSSKEGRSAFSNADLLKLYLYAYLNRTRSSRRMERLCELNIEVQWLLKGLTPCYVTIANFRKVNGKGLKKLFKAFVLFLRECDLLHKDTVATDGCYFSGQNSKKNNYTRKKIERELKHIDKKVSTYLEELDKLDASEQDDYSQERRIEVAEKLEYLNERTKKYEGLEAQMTAAEQEGKTQISTIDPDTQKLTKGYSTATLVGVNAVATGEAKNKFVINLDVINQSDTNALSKSALASKKILGLGNQNDESVQTGEIKQNDENEQTGGSKQVDESEQAGQSKQNDKNEASKLKVLGDAGFDTGSELKICIDNDIQTYVAPRKSNNGSSKAAGYRNTDFDYDYDSDSYGCPVGEQLVSNGKTFTKKASSVKGKDYEFEIYKLAFAVCSLCPHKNVCLSKSDIKRQRGRQIERSEYQDYKDENKERVRLHKDLYRKRQEIIEHQFGTIKRGWGYRYTLMKGLPKIEGEFNLIFTVYNIRRAITILGVKKLIEMLKAASISIFCEYTSHFKPDSGIQIFYIGEQMKNKIENSVAYKLAMAA